jgi:PhnB protein
MNDDGTYHVAELSIEGRVFHLHEANVKKSQPDPEMVNGTTVMIGLFVEDVDAVMNKAVAAGAELIHSAEDFDYGYRQGEFKDPFGHLWLIEKKI